MSLPPLFVHIDKPAFVRKQHSCLAAKDNKNKILKKEKKKAPNHPDEIKRIYSIYKKVKLPMTCSLTHLQAQVP